MFECSTLIYALQTVPLGQMILDFYQDIYYVVLGVYLLATILNQRLNN